MGRLPPAIPKYAGMMCHTCFDPLFAALQDIVAGSRRELIRLWPSDGPLGSYSGPEVLVLYRKRAGSSMFRNSRYVARRAFDTAT